jgi:hypothetical protein
LVDNHKLQQNARREIPAEQRMLNSDTRFHPPSPEPKQALVLVHGMGEQEPMGTIRDFVKAVWVTDENVRDAPPPHDIWIKPDLKTGLQELKRITTKPAKDPAPGTPGYRTDFFELYWADLNKGSTLTELENWIVGLLLRNPFTSLPLKLIPAWFMLIVFCLFLVYLALIAALGKDLAIPFANLIPLPLNAEDTKLANTILTYAIGLAPIPFYRWLLANIGCVVKYTRARPENIAARKNIRERGLELLEALHDGTYERIIIVSHSLGTILAYDLLSMFWATHSGGYSFEMDSKELPFLTAVERAAKPLRREDASHVPETGNWAAFGRALKALWKPRQTPARTQVRQDYDAAQRALANALRTRYVPPGEPDQTRRWLITDFITLGSPLAHSHFLLYGNEYEFGERKKNREIAISPPVEEKRTDPWTCRLARECGFPCEPDGTFFGMSFPFRTTRVDGFAQEFWQMHHAALFAVVRWTNIYAPHHFCYLQGDVISGPLATLFGGGVHDINLDDIQKPRWFAHTKYWAFDADNKPLPAILKLREAINLGCEGGV